WPTVVLMQTSPSLQVLSSSGFSCGPPPITTALVAAGSQGFEPSRGTGHLTRSSACRTTGSGFPDPEPAAGAPGAGVGAPGAVGAAGLFCAGGSSPPQA